MVLVLYDSIECIDNTKKLQKQLAKQVSLVLRTNKAEFKCIDLENY